MPRRSSRLVKRDESQPALLRSAHAELRRAGKKRVELLSRPEINLPFLEVDLQDSDAKVGARFVNFSGAATSKGALGGVEGEEVVLNR